MAYVIQVKVKLSVDSTAITMLAYYEGSRPTYRFGDKPKRFEYKMEAVKLCRLMTNTNFCRYTIKRIS